MTRNVITNEKDATLTKFGANDQKMNLYKRLELTCCIWWLICFFLKDIRDFFDFKREFSESMT